MYTVAAPTPLCLNSLAIYDRTSVNIIDFPSVICAGTGTVRIDSLGVPWIPISYEHDYE